jgi:ABC-type multidrug transport system ATPase subunit
MFDRIILMHEGNVVYQAPANEITSYLGSLNIILPKFKNPADFIIRMV